MPKRGDPPVDNRPPVLRITKLDTRVDKAMSVALTLEDPDGHAAVGVVTVGPFTLKMDRPGAFTATVSTADWPEGDLPVDVVLCDGWTKANYSLGPITVSHEQPSGQSP